MFKKGFLRVVWSLLMISLGFMIGSAGNTLAQAVQSRGTFPSANRLPADFQKKAAATGAAYQDLLTAEKESHKAFENLKRTVARKNPLEIQIAFFAYEGKDTEHWRCWLKMGTLLSEFDQIAADFLSSMDSKKEFEWRPYSDWVITMTERWERASPMKTERLETIKNAWSILSQWRRSLLVPSPRGNQ